MNEAERQRRARAAARRDLPGARIVAGTPKPALYADLDLIERVEAMWRLCLRQWLASNPPPAHVPRNELPGERFDIEAERARSR